MKNYVSEIVTPYVGTIPFEPQAFFPKDEKKLYAIRLLSGERDVKASLALQKRVIDDLPPEKKSQVIIRDDIYFREMQGQNGLMVGIENPQGVLVAHGALGLPTQYNKHHLGRGELSLPDGVGSAEELGVLQCLHVHPDEGGKGHAGRLVDARLDILDAVGRPHAICKITTTNVRSYTVYAKRGAVVFSLNRLEDENAYLLGLHKPLHMHYVLDKTQKPQRYDIIENYDHIRELICRKQVAPGVESRDHIGQLCEENKLDLFKVKELSPLPSQSAKVYRCQP